MPPTLPPPTKSRLRRTIACLGDSLTDNLSLGNFGFEFWPTQLETLLDSTDTIADGLSPAPPLGCNCKCRNLGQSGRTSGPYVAATATCSTVNSPTSLALTAVTGTFKAGQTIVVNNQMAQILSYSAGTATLQQATSGLSSGNAYPVYGLSDYGADLLTAMNLALGRKTPKSLDLLYTFGSPEWDPPDILAIWVGVNDPGETNPIAGLNLATTVKSVPSLSAPAWPQPVSPPGGWTNVPLATGQGANAAVGQAVAIVDWTQAPPRVWVGLVVGKSGDTVYLSGNTHAPDYNRSSWINSFPPGPNPLPGPLPPAGASVYQGTQANIVAACLLAAQHAGTSKFLVANTQYLNYSAGGDTLATPSPTYATLRGYQAAAVTMLQNNGLAAVLVDVYGYMRGRIAAGDYFTYRQTGYTAVQGDHAWHFADGNQHLNPLGNAMVAQAFLAAIQAQVGWLDALRV